MTSEDLKLREKDPKDLHGLDKTLQKVRKGHCTKLDISHNLTVTHKFNLEHTVSHHIFSLHFCIKWESNVFLQYSLLLCFAGDAVNTKSKRQSEKLTPKTPPVEAAITLPDPAKDVKSSEEVHSLSPEAEPGKDCRKGLKGKHAMDRQSTKSGASSSAPRITIKLVAKKKMKTVKEPHKKSVKKIKIKDVEDQSKAKDIQGDEISSAHVKLKVEPHEGKHGTEDKGGGTAPARRRGRSASKTEPVCQAGAKNAVDDQKSRDGKSADPLDAAKESRTEEPKTNAKKLKHKDTATQQSSEVNQLVTRRSNRATNPLSKGVSDSAGSQSKKGAVAVESKSEVSRTVEAKPSLRGDRRRQSRRLNKDAAVPENPGLSSTETDNLAIQPSECMPLNKEDMAVPSLKLIRVRNPKYDAQASGKNSMRKKKRKKFIWTLTLVKEESRRRDAENTVKVVEKTVSEVDQSSLCVNKGLNGMDAKSNPENSTPQETESMDNNECSHIMADVSSEEKSTLPVESEVEHVTETPPPEISKTDCGKIPPLQIKKVSSPGKHKSSKPSFLIQQVSPVPEKKEDAPKEVDEDKTPCVNAEVTPTRRLRRRTSSLDSPQTKSVSHKPVTTPKRRLRTSPQDEDTRQVQVEETSQVSTEDSSSHVLPENTCEVLAEDPSQVTSVSTTEALAEDSSSKVPDEPSQVPGETSPQKVESEVEPQIEEAKQLPVPSKPRRCRNNKLGKKKTAQKKKVAISPKTTVNTEVVVETTNTESVPEADTLPLVTEVSQPEVKDCSQSGSKQDTVSVEEEQIQPLVKEETDIQLIDSQQTLVTESQAESDPKTLCLQKKSHKKVKKRRKNLIGQRQKHRHRSRDGKFAPLKLSENQQNVEGDSDLSNPLAATTPVPSSNLIGVHKKYKKTQTGLQLFGSKRPKPPNKIISELIETGLEKDSLKQEESDTLVDAGQVDIVDTPPGKSKFVKNIKHFIMPVVSARSSRVIKTPQRFMDDAGMSVLPRRNSPKKGVQLGLQIRPGKRRDDVTDRAISPILPVDEEDILSEAQLDVDLFSAQDLEDNIDIPDSLFSERKSGKNGKERPPLKNSSWHVPEESSEEMYTLDKTPENKCEDLFLPTPVDKPTELSTDPLDAQKKKTFPKFNKQAAHLKIYQRLKKVHTMLPKSKNTPEMDIASKPPQPTVDLAEGLDDEAMSISLRQRNTNVEQEKEKSKLKIEDLDTPGVVRKVSVCVRTMNSKSLALQLGKEGDLAGKDVVQLHPGKPHF